MRDPSITHNPAPNPVEAPRFSILLPSWNNRPYLELCLRYLREQSRLPLEIVVHVNQGSDDTLELVRDLGLAYTHSPKNVGVCRAVNAARSLARADWLVYLNDDMLVLPGWDEALWRGIEAIGHTRCYVSGTLVEPRETGNPCPLQPHDYGQDLESFDEAGLLAAATTLGRADWNGAAWPPSVLHRTLWDEVGGFSVEYFPGYYSDPDLCQKLWSVGVREFKGVGDSLIYHFMGKSTKRHSKKTGYATFARKWGTSPRFFYRKVLKMGSDYTGPLPEFTDERALRKERLRMRLKTLLA